MTDEADANNTAEPWVGTLTEIIRLSDAEKDILDAIVKLGSFTANANDTYDGNYPDAISSLEDRGFLRSERVGETLRRGRPVYGTGVDVYRPTETAVEWLTTCKREAT